MVDSESMHKASARRSFSSSVMALALWVGAQTLAHAIPPGQRDWDSDLVDTSSTSYVLVPNTKVTVNNDVLRHCVIEFSAEARSSINDAVAVGYTVDSIDPAACIYAGGPRQFHASHPYTVTHETHTVVWVRPIGRGLHTIRACYVAVEGGGDPTTVSLFRRSLTVGCRTQ